MKKEQLLRKVLFSLLVSLLINVTEGFHFEKEKTLPGPAEPETWVSPGSCSGRARGGSWGWQYPFPKSSSWHWDLGTRNSISSCWSEEHTPSSSALWRFSALTLLSNLNFFKRNMLLVHGAANKSIIGKFINAAAELFSRDDSLYWWGVFWVENNAENI